MKGHVVFDLTHNPHVPWARVCTHQERERVLYIPGSLLTKPCTCGATITREKPLSSFYNGMVETIDTPGRTYPK